MPTRVRALMGAAGVCILATLALLGGLVPNVLRTGQIDPLDWLVPQLVALVPIMLLAPRRDWSAIQAWTILVLPLALLLLGAASAMAWRGFLFDAMALMLAAWLAQRALSRRDRRGWILLGVAGAGAALGLWYADRHDAWSPVPNDARPVVLVVTALPLQGPSLAEAEARSPLDAVGLRSPLWQALARRLDLRPADRLDAQTLGGARRLLLAQPRQLAPEELVALDDWVRDGGQALILADPLLHWPDPRPLGSPRRPPLTSLLDPLLGHWGLRLEPAPFQPGRDPVERHILAGGALLQLAGASRFALVGAAPSSCTLAEGGLFANCAIGRGQALIVADADWINDALWTLEPGHPVDRAAWTSDALPILAAALGDDSAASESAGPWLIDESALLVGLRWALLCLLLVALAPMARRLFPMSTQAGQGPRPDHNRNKGVAGPHSTQGDADLTL